MANDPKDRLEALYGDRKGLKRQVPVERKKDT
jgi:hypothetical protein